MSKHLSSWTQTKGVWLRSEQRSQQAGHSRRTLPPSHSAATTRTKTSRARSPQAARMLSHTK